MCTWNCCKKPLTPRQFSKIQSQRKNKRCSYLPLCQDHSNDGHRAGCKHRRCTFAGRYEGELQSKELRQKQAGSVPEDGQGKALAVGHGQKWSFSKGKLTYHFWGKPGHLKWDYRKWTAEKNRSEQTTGSSNKQSASTAEVPEDDTETMMITIHALSTVLWGKWIVDSGATCHMCNDQEQLIVLRSCQIRPLQLQ